MLKETERDYPGTDDCIDYQGQIRTELRQVLCICSAYNVKELSQKEAVEWVGNALGWGSNDLLDRVCSEYEILT